MEIINKNKEQFTAIGKPVRRIVGRKKVTGGLRYTAEIREDEMLYAFPVTATIAAGEITRMDTSKAAAAGGVVKIYTQENLTDIGAVSLYGLAGRGGSEFAPMENNTIKYGGQMIAVVVAETIEAGEYAVRLIQVDYREEKANASLKGQDGIKAMSKGRGDLEAGRAEGDVELEVKLHQPVHFHNPIEPPATLAVWNGPQVTVYEPSQGVTSLQTYLGRALKIPTENVRVISEYIGGGFGVKGISWFHTPITALIARDMDRPIKMLPSRENMYGLYGHRPESEQHIRLSAKNDGKLTAYEMTSKANTSVTDNFLYGAMVEGHLMINSCPNAKASINLVKYNTNTPIPMRSPGEAESHYAHSIAIDMLADKLGMDPLDVHDRNYADVNLHTGNPWSSKHLRDAWSRAAEKFGWRNRNLKPRSVTDGDYLVGMGMSIGAYPGYQSIAQAKVRVYPNGTAEVLCGSQSLGQGNYTVMAQAAAEELGIDPQKIKVSLGDTDLPRAQLSGGSRSASAVTGGVMAAARDVKQLLCEMAANDPASPLKDQKVGELVVESLVVYDKSDRSRSITAGQLMNNISQQYMEGYGEWGGKEMTPRDRSRLLTGTSFILGPEIEGRSSYSYIATFAEVKVHRITGMYKITRIVSGYDCGRIMNPKLAESQCRGGIIFAIGHACSEETAFDPIHKRIVNNNIADYHIPVQADVPEIDIIFVNEPDMHVHPVGMKGVGEVAGTGAAAAILNAMYNATGRRVTKLPAYPEKLVG